MDQTTVTMIMTTTQTAMITARRITWVWGQISGSGGGVGIVVGEAKPVGWVFGVPVELVVGVGVGVGVEAVGCWIIVGLTVGVGVGRVGLRVGRGLTVMAFVVDAYLGKVSVCRRYGVRAGGWENYAKGSHAIYEISRCWEFRLTIC